MLDPGREQGRDSGERRNFTSIFRDIIWSMIIS